MWYLWLAADDQQFTFEAAGVLNAETGQAIADAMESVMRHPGGRDHRIRLSLTAVGQADQAGIHVLRRCRARAQMLGLTLQICDLSPSVRRAIRHSAYPRLQAGRSEGLGPDRQ
jgi:anti-anti-sigma regulatory factor